MNKNIYVIYDRLTSVYDNFFVAYNDADALRRFLGAIRDNPFKLDLDLFKVGEIVEKGTTCTVVGCYQYIGAFNDTKPIKEDSDE